MPLTPIHHEDRFVAVAAGVFHSAAITIDGDLLTWGSSSHGQCLDQRWTPPDGSKLVDVVLGRHHTAVVDDRGRIWTFGDNKYGQLGRSIVLQEEADPKKKKKKAVDPLPSLVDGSLGKANDGSCQCMELVSGWSHMIARVRAPATGSEIYGWGRSDKGQLGCQEKSVTAPRLLNEPLLLKGISMIACGSEASYFLDEDKSSIYSCGWNEHGNLGIDAKGDADEDVPRITQVAGTERIVSPPTYSSEGNRRLVMAAGGAHLLVLRT